MAARGRRAAPVLCIVACLTALFCPVAVWAERHTATLDSVQRAEHVARFCVAQTPTNLLGVARAVDAVPLMQDTTRSSLSVVYRGPQVLPSPHQLWVSWPLTFTTADALRDHHFSTTCTAPACAQYATHWLRHMLMRLRGVFLCGCGLCADRPSACLLRRMPSATLMEIRVD